MVVRDHRFTGDSVVTQWLSIVVWHQGSVENCHDFKVWDKTGPLNRHKKYTLQEFT